MVEKKLETQLIDGVVVVQDPNQMNWEAAKIDAGNSYPLNTVTITSNTVLMQPPVEDQISKVPAKKVETFDHQGIKNGHLIEIAKEGRFTKCYLTTIAPGAFKGFHLHVVRTANYVCLKGQATIILYGPNGREEHVLRADNPERLHIPTNIPTGLLNTGEEEAWIINYPDPAYDPELKGEQREFTFEQCERGEHRSGTSG